MIKKPSPKTSKLLHSMTSVAIMAGRTVLNAVAFIGANYLARFLSVDDPKASLEEKKTRRSSGG